MNKFRLLVWQMWRPTLVILLEFSFLIALGIFRLGTLTHGATSNEYGLQQQLAHRVLYFSNVLRSPINLPVQLVWYLLETIRSTSLTAVRGVSVGFGFLSILSFYLILEHWYSKRITVLGSILFATSSWLLHISRLANAEILLCFPLFIVLCALWLIHSKYRKGALFLLLFVGLLSIYVPGLLWFVIIGTVWQARRIWQELSQVEWWFQFIFCISVVLLLFPFAWSMIHAPHMFTLYLGLPEKWAPISQILSTWIHIPIQFFIHGPNDPSRWLDHLPILDLFSTAMAIIGIYASWKRFGLDRTKLLIGFYICGSLLVAFGGNVTITLLVPFVYLLVVSGVAFMLEEWFTIFPRNPLARGLATFLMGFAIAVTAFYQLDHYFVAWPNAPETKAVFATRPHSLLQ